MICALYLAQELEKVRSELSSQAAELKTLKKENKKRKKIIQAYQDMLNAGATGVHSVRAVILWKE